MQPEDLAQLPDLTNEVLRYFCLGVIKQCCLINPVGTLPSVKLTSSKETNQATSFQPASVAPVIPTNVADSAAPSPLPPSSAAPTPPPSDAPQPNPNALRASIGKWSFMDCEWFIRDAEVFLGRYRSLRNIEAPQPPPGSAKHTSTPTTPVAANDTSASAIAPPPANFTSCYACHAVSSSLLKCGGCMRVAFCSKECQMSGWKMHKGDCKKWKQYQAQEEVKVPMDTPTTTINAAVSTSTPVPVASSTPTRAAPSSIQVTSLAAPGTQSSLSTPLFCNHVVLDSSSLPHGQAYSLEVATHSGYVPLPARAPDLRNLLSSLPVDPVLCGRSSAIIRLLKTHYNAILVGIEQSFLVQQLCTYDNKSQSNRQQQLCV